MPGEEGFLYADKRHLYGGIEPSNMRTFEVGTVMDSDTQTRDILCELHMVPPENTVIDGQTICTVAGYKVIYNLFRPPINEFDGTIISIEDACTEFGEHNPLLIYPYPDSLIGTGEISPTSYVAAFPFSTQNVYNRSPVNCGMFNPPPLATDFSVSQIYDLAIEKVKVSGSITLPTRAQNIVIGRMEGILSSADLMDIAPEYCHKAIQIENVIEAEDGASYTAYFYDTDVEPLKSYTYIAFPSISNNIYSRGQKNIAVITISNGIHTPPPLEGLKVTSLDAIGVARVSVKWPTFDDDDNNGKTTQAGVRIVYGESETYSPNGPEDDNYSYKNIAVSNGVNHITIGNLTPGGNYTFRAFTWIARLNEDESVTTIYNSDDLASNKVERFRMRAPTYCYGFDLNQDDPDPSTRITYPSDVDNYNFTPVTAIDVSPTVSSWDGIIGLNTGSGNLPKIQHFMPRACAVDDQGNVVHYLNTRRLGYTVDGEVSGVGDADYPYNVMMEWPKIYVKRTLENGIYKFRISDMQLDGVYDCWCNWNKDDKTVSHFYTGVFPMRLVNDIARSIYIVDSAPYTTNSSIYTDKAEAHLTSDMLNAGYYVCDFFSQHLLVQDLCRLITKNSNYGPILGIHSSTTNNTALQPTYLNPTRIDLPPFYDVYIESLKRYNNRLFGMFYYTGCAYNLMEGFMVKDHALYYKMTPGLHDGTKTTLMTANGDADNDSAYEKWHKRLPYLFPEYKVGALSAYIANINVRSLDIYHWGTLPYIPESSGASDSTYECCRVSAATKPVFTNNASTLRVLYGCGNHNQFTPARDMSFFIGTGGGQSTTQYAITRICLIPTKTDGLHRNDIKNTDPYESAIGSE